MFLIRVLLFPFKLLWAVAVGSARAGWWTAKLPVRASAGTARAVGFKGFLLLVVGIALGLLFAPSSGRELREKIRARIQGETLSDTELADKVGFELSHAPRTWHLPQPEVAVVAGRVELRGEVPHETGRDELERVAASVPGVQGVDNRLEVGGGNGASEEAAAT